MAPFVQFPMKEYVGAAIVNVVNLRAEHWKAPDDFYNALLRKLGAPAWHGKNIDALIDSMIVGGVNQLQSPMRIVVTGLNEADASAFGALISAFVALGREGAMVQITGGKASIEIADGMSSRMADDNPR